MISINYSGSRCTGVGIIRTGPCCRRRSVRQRPIRLSQSLQQCSGHSRLMRGALETKANKVSIGMCLAASTALAGRGGQDTDNILPSSIDAEPHATVAEAVATEAAREGLARSQVRPGNVDKQKLTLNRIIARHWSGLPPASGTILPRCAPIVRSLDQQ